MPIDKLLKNIQGNPAVTGALSGAAGGALVTAFANKKTAKTMLKTGGLMAVGGLAWQAYQSYTSKAEPDSSAPVTAAPSINAPQNLERQQFDNVLEAQAPDNGVGLITSAMIAAAHADGQLTEDEKQRIWQHAISTGISSEELAALATELETPGDVGQLILQADSFEKKLEVYSASLLVIEEGCDAGAHYLDSLGEQMQLPKALLHALHQQANLQVSSAA